jgi:hypothetical protein
MPYKILAVLAAVLPSFSRTEAAQEELTGDVRLACEAVLCLSSGSRPNECSPSLSRYFGISRRKLQDTIRARGNFLKLCPASHQSPEMAALVNATASGAGRCDAASLNAVLRMWNGPSIGGHIYVSDRMPDYCAAYIGHEYVDSAGSMPRYVGTPERGGHWVEAQDYDWASAKLRSDIQAENEKRFNGVWSR